MSYVLAASSSPSFTLKGMAGYEFKPVKDEDFAVHLLDVQKGHDTFMISKALTRIYYIIEGAGVFTIDNQKYDVVPGLIVEVPPGVEYSYTGSMKILLVSHPRWFAGNERMTRSNPDVVGEHGVVGTIVVRLRRYLLRIREQKARLHLVQIFLVTRYLWVARGIWRRIPARLRSLPVLVRYGAHLHSLVLRFVDRRQNHSTFFFRNRAELELMRRLTAHASQGSSIDVAVIACSKGCEVYSIAWTLKTARPDLTINLGAVDVSPEIVEFAKRGVYSLHDVDIDTYRDQLPGYSPFMFMSESEKHEMFDQDGEIVRVKSWVKEGISWHRADAGDPELRSILGLHDIVIANRFLCHMEPTVAERILRNVSRILKPGGYLFVSGVDLDVRMRVAMDMKWEPVTELMEEIHDGDPSLRDGWPLDYWAKEPIEPGRRDAMIRYASAFKISASGPAKCRSGLEEGPDHEAQEAAEPIIALTMKGA
jgi:chemotaxis methyl-accepting protein methylase/mannose-6-phosphate isomerase-like protein (cupin superfamily)